MSRPGPSLSRASAARLRVPLPAGGRALIANAVSLMGTTAITSGLGVAYWWVAARGFSKASVGFASAAVSAMTLVATLASLGLGTMLMGELPQLRTGRERLIRTSLAVSAALAAGLGAVYCLLAPVLSDDLAPLRADAPNAAVFVVGTVVTAVGLVCDQALIGLLRGSVQLRRNVVLATSKLVILAGLALAVAGASGMSLFATWVAGSVLSLAVVVRLLARGREEPGAQTSTRRELLRAIAGRAVEHQTLNLALKAPILALPVLVVALLSTESNASFYIAWMMANLLAVVSGSLAGVLYAVGAADASALAEKIRMTLRLSWMVSIASVAVIVVLADPLMRIFGASYADDGTWPLRILAASVIPLVVKNHYVTVCRIRRRFRQATILVWAGSVLEIGAAAAGAAIAGLDGLSLAWALVIALEAIVMAPTVLAARRASA